ncbi:MAG TPA: hypothetical protein VFN10_18090 [Thermoanaerobaculia bacterium]|nr:hypothetical protein [Thermoanaerobaculia bacterium]
MTRKSLFLVALLVVALALPATASQFIERSFDDVARGSALVARGTIQQTWSAWDDAHEVIYTYATLRVNRYFGESTGPDTLVVREVGGTVADYTQEAIGFPMLRGGEQVVLFLNKWDNNSADYRIEAYTQGKYVVRNIGGIETLSLDPITQGQERLNGGALHQQIEALPSLTIDEFSTMVDAARAALPSRPAAERQQ